MEVSKNMNKIYNIQSVLLFLCLSIITILVFAQVILRYVLKFPLMGIEEVLFVPAIWLYFLGSANASLERSQLEAPVIEAFLTKPKSKKIFQIIKSVLSFIISCWLTYWAYIYLQYSIYAKRVSATLNVPLVYADSAVFISFFLMDIFIFLDIINYVRDITLKSNELDYKEL